MKEISPEVMNDLNTGLIPSANLVEWLAVDQLKLLHHTLREALPAQSLAKLSEKMDALPKKSVNTLAQAIGAWLANEVHDPQLLGQLAAHPSDTVRGWMCYRVAAAPTRSFSTRLIAMQDFAADAHFGVREVAWMALRPHIIKQLPEALTALQSFAKNEDPNLRRFASEASRPRGVWCAHIPELKKDPALALPLLELLKNDPSRYVQDSLGNWLNDAAKNQPEFVRNTCAKWLADHPTKATEYIVKRGLRNL